MLYLSRGEGQRLTLTLPDGRTVTVDVLELDRGRVRLGIDAPCDIIVDREEIARLRKENRRG